VKEMREIKFRAWDKRKRIMVYRNENESADYWDGVYGTEVELINSILNDSSYEFMQYTGLKDINGKEIYEGDIVETDLGKGIVVFDSAAFLIRNLEDDEYYGFDDFFSLYEGGCYLVEVIGNIYEHPHLLEAKGNEHS
jgi:uncharacterized phage protein (TIGR01671 family)